MELSLGVTLAVLGGWPSSRRAGTRSSSRRAAADALLDTATIIAGSTLCSFCALPVPARCRSPRPGRWRSRRSSSTFGYYLTLAEAYRTGDLSFALSADARHRRRCSSRCLGIVFLGELPSPRSQSASCSSARHRRHRVRAAAPVIRAPPCTGRSATQAIIGVYTLIDGTGARASATRCRTSCYLTFLEGVVLPRLDSLAQRRPGRHVHRTAVAARACSGGFCSVAAYGIVLWAMTRRPIAAVSALRETSVLFAAVIGTVLLKEGFGIARLAGAASVVAGGRRAQALTNCS
jgi:uncharacterized membrane protein